MRLCLICVCQFRHPGSLGRQKLFREGRALIALKTALYVLMNMG
ncbi:MAG TPA: hypothetical protein VGK21_04000 [Candidatus Angelobacter sp.]|jgi:hypothetical protein